MVREPQYPSLPRIRASLHSIALEDRMPSCQVLGRDAVLLTATPFLFCFISSLLFFLLGGILILDELLQVK